MNPVYHELKGLVSFVKKAESVKSLQYCLEQSGKRIFNFFLSLPVQDVTWKNSDAVELKIYMAVDFPFLGSPKRLCFVDKTIDTVIRFKQRMPENCRLIKIALSTFVDFNYYWEIYFFSAP